MMSKVCPKCGMMNADDRVVCTNCGIVLPAAAPAQTIPNPTQAYAPQPPVQPAPAAPYPSAPIQPKKRYGVLRTVSGIFNILAWLGLIGGVALGLLGSIFGMGEIFRDSVGFGIMGVIFGVIAGVILGLFWFMMFKYSAEMIHLAIDLEENTRRTAEFLEKMK
ncbi:MAG: hypothetical protein VB108_11160 [Anaerolineaceae bacterium]|nr:hypothetical protein [Anaerolineaceae bacterium]